MFIAGVLTFFSFLSRYCSSRENLTIDHVFPAARGGEWKWENLVGRKTFILLNVFVLTIFLELQAVAWQSGKTINCLFFCFSKYIYIYIYVKEKIRMQ